MNQPPSKEESQQWPQYLAAITSILMSVSAGIHYTWPSPAIPKLLAKDLQFHLSKEEISYIVMISPLGYIVGCPMSAFLLDKIGRKFAILILAAPQILAWLLIANSTGVSMLYVARLTSGISEGGSHTTIPVYIAEISEPKLRGALGISYAVAFVFGGLLINCYGSYLPLRISAYTSITVPLLFLVTFIWMPESPYYSLMKGYTEDARRSLRRLRNMQDVEEELMKLTSDVQRQISEPKSIRDVFTVKSNLKAFLIIMGLRTVQQFSGGAAITLYNQVIFQQAAGSISFVKSSIIFNAILVVVSFCGSLLVDHTGRKPLLILSTIGTGISLSVEGFYFALQYHNYDVSSLKWLPITGVVLYTSIRSVGLVSLPPLITGEIFSASVKTKAVGMINIYFALCISVSSKMFHWFAHTFAMYVPFFLFSFCCVIGTFFVHFYVPETKGKTLEEIQQCLKGNVTTQTEP